MVADISGDTSLSDPDGYNILVASRGGNSYVDPNSYATIASSAIITGGAPGTASGGKGAGGGSGPSLNSTTNGNNGSGQTGGPAPSGGYAGGNGGNANMDGQAAQGLGAGGGGAGDAAYAANTAGLFLLDENTGTSTADASGNGHTGSLRGGAAWTTTGTHDGIGVSLDGINDYIDCGAVLSGSKSACTIAFWANRSSTSDELGCGISPDISHQVCVELSSNGNIYFHVGDGADKYRASWPGPTGLKHYCLVYDGSLTGAARIAGYIDAVAQTGFQSDTPNSSINFTGSFEIGRRTSSIYSKGTIDSVVIYDRALSSSEVASLFNDGPLRGTSKSGGAGTAGRGDITIVGAAPTIGQRHNRMSGGFSND
jgi:hypothetical protein